MAYGQEDPGTGEWRARYKRPDGTWGASQGSPLRRPRRIGAWSRKL
jgi:hypothetical protein